MTIWVGPGHGRATDCFEPTPGEASTVDPTAFLSALLKVGPEDAATVGDDAAKTMEKEDRDRVERSDTEPE